MLTAKDFDRECVSLSDANDLPLELARTYVSLIGDTPELDAEGKLVVRDRKGGEVARLTPPARG